MTTQKRYNTSVKLTTSKIKIFREKIWNFYKLNKRDFPWRETSDFYKIFISEVMLQQTQTSRVIPKYLLFLEKFPNMESLTLGTNEEVLRLWSGLGYNRRALYLKRAAEIITNKKEKILTPIFLQTLPGIGPNTAGSIYVFSYNLPHVFIETNIRRVFIHEFFKDREKVTDKEILELAEEAIDRENPRDWYYALMDYGAHLGRTLINPNLKSKHYIKQSKFEGSLRQTRGKILKILLEKKSISREKLKSMINSHHFEKALSLLKKENFLAESQTEIKIIE